MSRKKQLPRAEHIDDEEYDGPPQYFIESGKIRKPARWGSHEADPAELLGELFALRKKVERLTRSPSRK